MNKSPEPPHRDRHTTLLVLAIAITFGGFSVYKALGGGTSTVGRTERSEVPAVAAPLSGTALAAGVDGSRTNTNPLASPSRLTNAPRPAVKTDLIPIEQIQVGDRVLAESPTGEEDTAFGSEIIPFDWRKLTLRAPKRDGTVAEVVLLRPLTWLNEQHGKVGGTVFISVPECGIDGNAEVLAIDSCPEIPSGAGRVVTGTFLHQARSTITLTIAGQSEPIECTGNHPFWSEDRQAFVRADSLQPNETLRTANGLTTVESTKIVTGKTFVCNLEVHGAHVYHVGTSGMLVHNGNALPCSIGELGVSGSVARRHLNDALGGIVGDTLEAHHIIPWEFRSHEIVERAARGGFNINGANNGILLPRGLHQATPFHPQYNAAISGKLDRMVVDMLGKTDAEVATALQSYVNQLLNGLQNLPKGLN